MGIRDKPIAPASPLQNGFAEQLIGSIRRKCLDHIIVLGGTHLHRILKSYARYYNETRTHLALEKDAPLSRTVKRAGRILCRPVLGGLHHQYVRGWFPTGTGGCRDRRPRFGSHEASAAFLMLDCEEIVLSLQMDRLLPQYCPASLKEEKQGVSRVLGQTKRILVTGGAGFLGSHLCERLLNIGHDVLSVDNFYTGTKKNLEAVLTLPNFEMMRHDITFPLYVEVDQIFNLACPASPIHYQYDPVQTTKTSVHGSINMLGLAKRLKAKILQASTSEVYGDPDIHPQDETYWGRVNPIGPRSCYDEGKRCAETLFFDYRRQHNLSIKVARIFNTYGPRMRPNDGRVVSNFIVQALTNRPITIFGDGKQTRSFCYVDDLIDGLIRLMDTTDDITGPINLGNPAEFTMIELAELVTEMTGSKSNIKFGALPIDDPKQRQPDIARARETLSWSPSVELRDGLARTIAYFETLLSQNRAGVAA
jgi:UDP-glucuronate decarboxylase